MTKQWHIVSFNPSFTRKLDEFLTKNKLKPTYLREKTFLVRAENKLFLKKDIQPFLISAQPLKKCKNEVEVKSYIQKKSRSINTYALRAWVLGHPTLTGRDLEVKLGIALEKKGVEMNPQNEERIWFLIQNGKELFVSMEPLSIDQHVFAPMDYRITENGFVTRSGQKLRFLLSKFHFDPKGKRGADLGCGTGGWTQLLIQEGATHVTAIDRTLLDKKLQQNKKVTYVHEKAENAPKLKQKIEFIVMDINVNPAHAQKIFLNFDKKNPGATHAILTQKILQGKDFEAIPKIGQKIGKWAVTQVGNSWFARRECYIGLEK